MHKKILLICMLLLLVGCSRIEKTDNYKTIINKSMVVKINTNNVSLGYKYYIPKGIKKINDYNYNQVFLVDESKIYLYVDIISYYYKKELKHAKNEQAIYYEEFNKNQKNGYIEIQEYKEKYFLKMGYNYSKIEVYTDKENLNKIIALSTIILNSIDYNNNVIEKVLEGDFGEFSEISYKIEKPEDASNNFSQYLEEYVQKGKKEQLPEE